MGLSANVAVLEITTTRECKNNFVIIILGWRCVFSVIKVLFQTIPHIQQSDWHCLCYCFFCRDDYGDFIYIKHLVQILCYSIIVLSTEAILCDEGLWTCSNQPMLAHICFYLFICWTPLSWSLCGFLYCRFSGPCWPSKIDFTLW